MPLLLLRWKRALIERQFLVAAEFIGLSVIKGEAELTVSLVIVRKVLCPSGFYQSTIGLS
jgi:hypothetical protein